MVIVEEENSMPNCRLYRVRIDQTGKTTKDLPYFAIRLVDL